MGICYYNNMSIKVAKKLEISTKAFIVEAVRDIISDPDFGLKLTKEAERRLRQAQTSKGKISFLSEIKKKYY